MLSSRLALANMRKKKGTSITLIVFILLATICLNTGLRIMDKCLNMAQEKSEELSGPDFIATCSITTYEAKFEEYLQEDSRVEKMEKEELLYMPTTKNKQNTMELGALIFNSDKEREIAPFQLVEEDASIPKDQALYAPLILKGYGVKVGDPYTLICKGKQYEFVIAGFFETNYYGTSIAGMLKYFVPEEMYEKLYSETGRAIILSAQLKEDAKKTEDELSKFSREFNKATDFGASLDNLLLGCLDAKDMKESCVSIPAVGAIVFIAFAIVLSIVILVVIVNRVAEHMEENMQNIGVLQAIGYTSKQVMGSIVMEFGWIAVIGCSLGDGLTYAILPLLKGIFSKSSGLVTIFGWNPGTDLLCFGVIVGAIFVTAGLASLKILKLPPVKALNKGMKAHHFGKNICPLYKGVGKVHFRIALKNVFSNKKQNIMYSLIIACSLFIIGLTMIMYINFATDRSMMFQMLGFELSDVQVQVTSQTDATEFSQELLAMEEVRKTNLSDLITLDVEDYEVMAITSDDFSQMEVLKPYKGSLPKYENEIVITGVLSNLLHKGMGDTITVTAEGRTKEFYIVGIYQSTNQGGYMVVVPYQGVVQIRPQYKIGSIDVYLEDGYDKDVFKEKLRTLYKVAVKDEDGMEVSVNNSAPYSEAGKRAEEKISKLLADYGIDSISYTVMQDGEVILAGDSYDYKIDDLGDYIEFCSGQLDSFSSMTVGIVGVVAIVTLVIIAGILSITIKSMLRKKREEYGVYKALGYTTKEIVKQISMNYALSALIGVTLGSIALMFGANSVMGVFFSGIGLTHMIFAIPYVPIIGLAVLLLLFTYGIAMIKAYQVRKISAYDLLIE